MTAELKVRKCCQENEQIWPAESKQAPDHVSATKLQVVSRAAIHAAHLAASHKQSRAQWDDIHVKKLQDPTGA